MPETDLKWRLEGGYSRFLDKSHLIARLKKTPATAMLDLAPVGLVKKTEPVEFLFRTAHPVRAAAGGLRWRLKPEARLRARLLFQGNAFLGNFRVPKAHFAVQWELEAEVEAGSSRRSSPWLLQAEAGTGFEHAWVSLFPEDRPIGESLLAAWADYRNPLDPCEVLAMKDGLVLRWSWKGRIRLGFEVNWGIGAGWSLPLSIPLARLRNEVAASAGLGSRFQVSQQGAFSLQVRRQGPQTSFRLKREREKKAVARLQAGTRVRHPFRIQHLGFSDPKALKVVSEGLAGPLVTRLNRAFENALTRHMEIGLAVERKNWVRNSTLLQATWPAPEASEFTPAYAALVRGELPAPCGRARFTGRFQTLRGRGLSLSLNFVGWGAGSSHEVTRDRVVTVGPAGEVLVEEGENLKKSSRRWEAIQFLRLMHRETIRAKGRDKTFLWTFGREGKFSHEQLRTLLGLALQAKMLGQFSLPARTAFPLKARLVLGTRFQAEGLQQVRQAGSGAQWEALVRALELTEPEKYGAKTFWRDWIDHPEVRQVVDKDPIQAALQSRYPVHGRASFEREIVVRTYRGAKTLMRLLERWGQDEATHLFAAFRLYMDLPLFTMFHLLCPPQLRQSAGVLSGEITDAWGDPALLLGQGK
jgi:hypothetical protein